jgi:hypothetical protein
MTPAQREQIRLSILRYLESAGWPGLGTGLILASIRAEGLRQLTQEQLIEELHYLADPSKDLIAGVGKLVSPENNRWHITATGRDWLAKEGYE